MSIAPTCTLVNSNSVSIEKKVLQPKARNNAFSKVSLDRVANRGVGLTDYVNHTNSNPRKGKRGPCNKRKHNQAKRKSDFVRYRKRLAASLFNNFPQNNILVHWFTGTYADQRVKSIDTAKKDFKKFIYGFGNTIKTYTAVVELDIKHHPHVHAMILTSYPISSKTFEDSWQHEHGFSVDKLKPNNFNRIINYLVKLYSDGESLSYSLSKAQELQSQENRLKRARKRLSEVIQSSKINNTSLRATKDDLWKKEYHIHQLKKAECQKQLTGKDNPILKSHGQKGYLEVANPSHSLCRVFQAKGIYQYSLVAYQSYLDMETGQLRKVILNRKDYYEFPPEIHSKLLYLMGLEVTGLVLEVA